MTLEELMQKFSLSFMDIPIKLAGSDDEYIKAINDFMCVGYSIDEAMELVDVSDKYHIGLGSLRSLLVSFKRNC